jgi:hypothetical protein
MGLWRKGRVSPIGLVHDLFGRRNSAPRLCVVAVHTNSTYASNTRSQREAEQQQPPSETQEETNER